MIHSPEEISRVATGGQHDYTERERAGRLSTRRRKYGGERSAHHGRPATHGADQRQGRAARLSTPDGQRDARPDLRSPLQRPAPAPGERVGARLQLRAAAQLPLQGQRLFPEGRYGRGLPYHPERDKEHQRARASESRRGTYREAAWARPRYGPDGKRQIYYPRRHDRQDQQDQARAHHER